MPSTVTRIRSTPAIWPSVQASWANSRLSWSSSTSSTSSLSGTSAVPSRETGTEIPSSRVPVGRNVRSTPVERRRGPFTSAADQQRGRLQSARDVDRLGDQRLRGLVEEVEEVLLVLGVEVRPRDDQPVRRVRDPQLAVLADQLERVVARRAPGAGAQPGAPAVELHDVAQPQLDAAVREADQAVAAVDQGAALGHPVAAAPRGQELPRDVGVHRRRGHRQQPVLHQRDRRAALLRTARRVVDQGLALGAVLGAHRLHAALLGQAHAAGQGERQQHEQHAAARPREVTRLTACPAFRATGRRSTRA